MPAGRRGFLLRKELVAVVTLLAWPVVGLTVEVTSSRSVMGTLLEITVSAPDEAAGRRILESGYDVARRLDEALSNWRPGTELSRFNRRAGHGALPVSRDLGDVLALSRRLFDETGGAFDVTLGPLILLYRKEPLAPVSRVRQASGLVDGAGLGVSSQGARPGAVEVAGCPGQRLGSKAAALAWLERPGMAVDLGGIGKGYAGDTIRAALVRAGATAGFIDFGRSTIIGFGPRDWKVELGDGIGGPSRSVILRDSTLSTSESLGEGGAILDPRDCKPVPGHRRVTVRYPSAAVADGWSTAIVVLGRQGEVLARRARPGLDVWYEELGDGRRRAQPGPAVKAP